MIQVKDLKTEYLIFGNRGDVFSNKCHIMKGASFSGRTLCGTPMLSTNHAMIENVTECGCKKCETIYLAIGEERNTGESLIISEDRNPECNPDAIKHYNKMIIGIKNAYYDAGCPELAKDAVVDYIQNSDTDFIYFMDLLFYKLGGKIDA